MKSFDSLPDEVALMIVKMAAGPGWDLWRHWDHRFAHVEYDHDFLVDVLSKVSRRFARLATGE